MSASEGGTERPDERHNPFEAPSSEWERGQLVAEASGDEFFDASQGTRFVNALIDGVVVTLINALFPFDGLFAPLLVSFLYYVVFETFAQRTPGKWITRTRVVTTSGTRPRFVQILGRTLTRWVPFEAFSFLGSRRGWHDRWSNTRVVHGNVRRRRRRRKSRRDDD